MLVLNLPFKALMFLTLMRPSLVLFLVLWRSEERFSRNAETDLVCRLLLEKKKHYEVSARNNVVEGRRSSEASATPMPPTTAPPSPRYLAPVARYATAALARSSPSSARLSS